MRLRRLPAGWCLAAIVVVSIVVRVVLGRRMVAPWIMVDELIYSELAKSFAGSGEFLVRGEATAGYGFVYPLLISPAWLFDAIPSAYAVAKTINAVLMSLAAVPSYFLARRFVSARSSLVVALLTVAVPSMLYTGTLMTENVFYPLFLCVALALVLTVERPLYGRVAVLLVLVVVAFLTRAQAVAVLPTVLVAPFLFRGRRALREYVPLWAPLASGAVLLGGVQLVRGRSLLDLLGAYETVGERSYSVPEVGKWLLWHVAELDLYVGVVPFAALLLLALLWDPRDRLFLATLLPLVACVVGVVATFASLPSVQRIEERNMFYVAPFLFVALMVWIERGLPRPPWALAVAAASAVFTAAVPYPRLIGVSAQSDTLMLLPWWWLQDQVLSLEWVRWEVLLCAAAAAAWFWAVPVRYALALPGFVLAYYALTAFPIENGRHGMRQASVGALFQGITTGDRDWVDAAVGHDADVAMVWSGRSDRLVVWQNEFFNRSVGSVYYLGDPVPGSLPDQRKVEAGAGGTLTGARPRRYVLADDAVELRGDVVERDPHKGVALYETDGTLGVTQGIGGVYADQWTRPLFAYERYRCRGGTVRLTLESDSKLFPRGQRLAILPVGRAVRLAAGEIRTVTVPLRASTGTCRIAAGVDPSAVPAQVVRGSTDTRRLGILLRKVEYEP